MVGGETINDDYITENGHTYTLSGDYNHGIAINTDQDVTIEIAGNVGLHRGCSLLKVINAGKLTINDRDNYIVEFDPDYANGTDTDLGLLNWGDARGNNTAMGAGAQVEINGGIYKAVGITRGFVFRGGKATMNGVTLSLINPRLGGGYASGILNRGTELLISGGSIHADTDTAGYGDVTAVENDFGTVTLENVEIDSDAGCAVKNSVSTYGDFQSTGKAYIYINDGTYTSKNGAALSNFAYSGCTAEVTINGGKFSSAVAYQKGNSLAATVYNGDTMEIHGGQFENTGTGSTISTSGNLTIDEKNGTTSIKNIGEAYPWVAPKSPAIYQSDGELTFSAGTVESSGDTAIEIVNTTSTTNAASPKANLQGGTIQNSKIGIAVSANRVYKSDTTLSKCTLANNETDIYLGDWIDITITDEFKGTATVKCSDAGARDNRWITTATQGTDYQEKLNLISKDEEYIIGYGKNCMGRLGEFRYLTKRVGYRVDAVNATASVSKDDTSKTLDKNDQIDKDTLVTLTADIPEGKTLTGWKIQKMGTGTNVTDLTVTPDENDPEKATFKMPAYDVTVTALYGDETVEPGSGEDGDSSDGGAGAVVAGVLIGGATYLVGTDVWLRNIYGFIPTNRMELAKALWSKADCPAPESTELYPDIDEDDTDAQAAARWCVEQGLLKDYRKQNDDGTETVTFKPGRYVARPYALTRWYKLEKLLSEQQAAQAETPAEAPAQTSET